MDIPLSQTLISGQVLGLVLSLLLFIQRLSQKPFNVNIWYIYICIDFTVYNPSTLRPSSARKVYVTFQPMLVFHCRVGSVCLCVCVCEREREGERGREREREMCVCVRAMLHEGVSCSVGAHI